MLINIEDRLPEVFQDVLALCISLEKTYAFDLGEKYFSIDRLVKWNDEWPICFRNERFYKSKVTHWMLLPEMPL